MIQRENFHTFDALRFFSFSLVFISHLPYTLFPKFNFIKTRGDIGVYFFFTLSGFLITYILLLEKKSTNTFDFKKYIKRRALRIWPLYYFILLFAFLSPIIISLIGLNSTSIGYNPNWLLSCLFLENYMVMFHNDFGNISPLPVLWSLCIEEHFYLIWGIILYFSKMEKILLWSFLIIIISSLSRWFFYINNILFKDILTNFDYFMYGAIPAYLYVNYKNKTLLFIDRISDSIKIIIVLITIIIVVSFSHFDFQLKQIIEPYIFGLLFSCVIFIVIPKNNKFKISDSNIVSKLGIYTYGLYIFHTIAINFFIKLNIKLNLHLSENYLFIFITGSSILTVIFTSIISYHLFEKKFLILK